MGGSKILLTVWLKVKQHYFLLYLSILKPTLWLIYKPNFTNMQHYIWTLSSLLLPEWKLCECHTETNKSCESGTTSSCLEIMLLAFQPILFCEHWATWPRLMKELLISTCHYAVLYRVIHLIVLLFGDWQFCHMPSGGLMCVWTHGGP